MMRRDGLSCCGNYARVLIISSLVVLSYVFRSKITGYAAKESVLCYLLHFSANVVADCCGRRGGGWFARFSLSVLGWSCEVAGVW